MTNPNLSVPSYSMHRFFLSLVFGISFGLMGCGGGNAKTIPSVEENIPAVVGLENRDGEIMGYGTRLYEDVFVCPDHIWQEAEKLYFGQWAIKVLARDFRHDMLFFRLPPSYERRRLVWKNRAPSLGEKLYWFDGAQLHGVSVISTNETFTLDEVVIKDLMAVDGILEPGDSGSPLFDRSGYIYGMLVATDRGKEKSYFVRADKILELLEELEVVEFDR